jgi:seryl-tRNA synthetase
MSGAELTGEDEFLERLVARHLLVPSGVAGIYGRGRGFEEIVLAFDAHVTRETAKDGAEFVRFPPIQPRRLLETSGYLASFPHLAGSIFGFGGDEDDALILAEQAGAHEDWSGSQTMTDLVLLPAACYPVYPWVASSGRLPRGGRLVDVLCYCFRHEPSGDPARMQAFRQREHVCLGPADDVAAWHRSWIDRGLDVLASVGLRATVEDAADPFFGRSGRMMAASQRQQRLKFELVYPIHPDGNPTAIMSINSHQSHFGADFGITTADGDVAHSACFGFGLERVALALFRAHGLDVEDWPRDIRNRLQV